LSKNQLTISVFAIVIRFLHKLLIFSTCRAHLLLHTFSLGLPKSLAFFVRYFRESHLLVVATIFATIWEFSYHFRKAFLREKKKLRIFAQEMRKLKVLLHTQLYQVQRKYEREDWPEADKFAERKSLSTVRKLLVCGSRIFSLVIGTLQKSVIHTPQENK
jgi:hypothetical protein